MIETFFSLGTLDTPNALFMSVVIGILFGIVLELAGFGSSRRLSGVFYFKDMAVIKVMFTAMITAVICLQLSFQFGLISEQAVYLNPTLYKAQVIGGIIFGIGFVMGGWCPGTAAVGAASGKWDAFVFLGGAVAGSGLFNETYSMVQGLFTDQNQHISFVYNSLGLSREWFLLFFVTAGILVFWGMELIEKKTIQKSDYLKSPFLKQFSFIFLIAGFFVFLVSGTLPVSQKNPALNSGDNQNHLLNLEQTLLSDVDDALDHMEPEDLAKRITEGRNDIFLVDIRPSSEFFNFHIRTARNIQLKQLVDQLTSYKNKGMIVLYSNGMTHPAQARDALARIGFQNVYLLTDGLKGFVDRCLKPVSLRSEPIPEQLAVQINQWRTFFLGETGTAAEINPPGGVSAGQTGLPTVVDSQWLSKRLTDTNIRIIDLRSQPEYNTAHIPGAYALNVESFRGNIYGVPSCLLPVPLLSYHLSLMGIRPETTVILVYGDKVQDATLAGMGMERLGHEKYGLLSGGFAAWKFSGMKTDTLLPETASSSYPGENKDRFSIDYKTVLSHVTKGTSALILDVRPKAYYTGEKSDEARAGHIPGAINRPYDKDTQKTGDAIEFKPIPELKTEYEKIIPSKQSRVIVHCRTGHQASQTFFVLKHLLGYEQILWYDAGWSQWSATPELPVKTGELP